jgi:hypothetical protein
VPTGKREVPLLLFDAVVLTLWIHIAFVRQDHLNFQVPDSWIFPPVGWIDFWYSSHIPGRAFKNCGVHGMSQGLLPV